MTQSQDSGQRPAACGGEPARREAGTGDLFDDAELGKDLGRKSVRGGAAVMLSQGARLVLRIGSLSVLARLLTPGDFGLVAMVNVIVGFVAMFKDAGLSMATIQRDAITREQVSTVFWINVGISLALVLITVSVAPLIAAFYGEPRLVWITIALASTLLFGGLMVQHQALLRRKMRFQTLAVIEVLSVVAGIAAGIGMALAGFGYWALVGMVVANSIAHTVFVWVTLRWWPGLPKRGTGVGSMLRFGGNIVGFNFLNYFARNADNVLIGKVWGAIPLGFYDKAYQLLMLPISQVNAPIASVAVPGLCRLQGDPARYRAYFIKGFTAVVAFTLPVVGALAVFAEEAVLLLLGPQWMDSVDLFRLLAVAAVGGAIGNPTGWLMISSGHSDRYLKLALFISPLIILSFALGLPYGARGVAIGYSVIMTLLILPSYVYATRGTPVRIGDIFGAMLRPLAAGGVAAGAGCLFNILGREILPPIVRLILGVGITLAVYLVLLLVVFRQAGFYMSLVEALGIPGLRSIGGLVKKIRRILGSGGQRAN